jgi:pimeloyl-ACP methyl ester carboxylesterase
LLLHNSDFIDLGGFMKRALSTTLVAVMFTFAALAQNAGVTLPFDLVDSLDGVKFKIRVPSNWNGTLLLYLQASKSTAPPPEPLVVPPTIDSPQPTLEATLLAQGYALAASEISTSDWQLKEEIQDTFALAAFFRAKVASPKRVIVWGSSLGGLAALKLIEDAPRSFDAAIPMCAPAAGWSRRMDLNLDFALAYAAVFGWPETWGPIADLAPGLLFARDVLPKFQLPAADGSNLGRWEFIRLVMGMPKEALYGTCPLYRSPMFGMIMMTSTQLRQDSEAWAAGPMAQNVDRVYSLKPDEKAYLASLGVNADDLLVLMNSAPRILANPISRTFITRFGDLRGKLTRPVLNLRNTLDGQGDVRHDSAYRVNVESWDAARFLKQAYITGVGHCAFTSKQLLLTLAAIESWLDSGVKPDETAFPTAAGFDHTFVPGPWPN